VLLFLIAAFLFILLTVMFPPSLFITVPLILAALVLKVLSGTVRWGIRRGRPPRS
jgi:hypothetical protein